MLPRMSKPKLTYFDAPVSRGEECRLALHVAGVDFEDDRIKREAWMELKPKTPYGSIPVFTMPGKPPIAHSNAILVLIGRTWNLHPKDDFEAARHEGMLQHVEDLRITLSGTMRIKDEEQKKNMRLGYVATTIPEWAAAAERNIEGPFFAGSKMHVVDIKLHMIIRWLKSGALDHVPATVLDAYPKLNRLHDAVRDDAKIQSWTKR